MRDDVPPLLELTALSYPIQEKFSLNLDHKSRIFQNLNGALGEEKGKSEGEMREAAGGPGLGRGSCWNWGCLQLMFMLTSSDV